MDELEPGDSAAYLGAPLHLGHVIDTRACLHCSQVQLMRFSSIFQPSAQSLPLPPEDPHAEETPQPATLPAPELPDDLDARVRLVGEWQVFEN